MAFIARDGYSLQRIFNELYPDIQTLYMFAPRLQGIVNRKQNLKRDLISLGFVSTFYSEVAAKDSSSQIKISERLFHNDKLREQLVSDSR